jgi:hypothetical protein
MSEITFTDDDLEIILGLKIGVENISAPRQAPACSNPSSPFFADDGDPLEYNVDEIYLRVNNKEILLPDDLVTEIYLAIEERLDNAVLKYIEKERA